LILRRFILILFAAAAISLPARLSAQRQVLLNLPNYDQESMFHFGFVLGVNQSLVTVRPIADLRTHVFDSTYIPDILPMPDSARVLTINSSPIPGFVVSIVANMMMGRHFELQFVPTLAFGDRTLNYEVQTYRFRPGAKDPVQNLTITKKIPSTYVSFPFEIKYKALRYNNFRPYLMVGALYSMDLASQAKKREQRARNEKIIKFNQNDIYAEAGVGFDLYNEWFKFGLEVKMMYGIFDVLKREHNLYTDSIDRLSSKIFQVSFTFM